VQSSLADVEQPEPDSDCSSATGVVQALDSSFTPSASKQPSVRPSDLGICTLRSGRQIGRETELKKYSGYLPGRQSIVVVKVT